MTRYRNRYRNRTPGTRYCPPFTPMIELVPEMEYENYRIAHIDVTEEDVEMVQLRSILGYEYREYYDFEPGRYVQLQKIYPGKNGHQFYSIMMSDTPMERRTNERVVRLAKGDVLIAGLGIGMILYPMIQKDEVHSIIVVEKAEPIIEMVGPLAYKWARKAGKKFDVVHADIFDLALSQNIKWDVIYFDIWSEVSGDNYDDMKRLTAKFKYRRNSGGWMGAWRKADMRESATGHYRDDHDEGFVK